MRKEIVILQALSLNFDKTVDVESTHELEHSHWPPVLRNRALQAGKTGFLIFEEGGEKSLNLRTVMSCLQNKGGNPYILPAGSPLCHCGELV